MGRELHTELKWMKEKQVLAKHEGKSYLNIIPFCKSSKCIIKISACIYSLCWEGLNEHITQRLHSWKKKIQDVLGYFSNSLSMHLCSFIASYGPSYIQSNIKGSRVRAAIGTWCTPAPRPSHIHTTRQLCHSHPCLKGRQILLPSCNLQAA